MEMKVLLDESTPRRLASSFPGSFEIRTVQQMGWAGCGNGELLRLATDHGFDSIITVDQGFEYQQNVADLPIPGGYHDRTAHAIAGIETPLSRK